MWGSTRYSFATARWAETNGLTGSSPYVDAYWATLRELFEDAFTNPEEYTLLRALGVYAANERASDLWDWLSTEGLEPTQESIAKCPILRVNSASLAGLRPLGIYQATGGVRGVQG